MFCRVVKSYLSSTLASTLGLGFGSGGCESPKSVSQQLGTTEKLPVVKASTRASRGSDRYLMRLKELRRGDGQGAKGFSGCEPRSDPLGDEVASPPVTEALVGQDDRPKVVLVPGSVFKGFMILAARFSMAKG